VATKSVGEFIVTWQSLGDDDRSYGMDAQPWRHETDE
jgi:hypothetical protein